MQRRNQRARVLDRLADRLAEARLPGPRPPVVHRPEQGDAHPEAAARYAAIVATGRSDFPNQINNVLAFPGVFRGALDAGARAITERMKLAAADAIFAVAQDDLAADRIVPSPLDPGNLLKTSGRGIFLISGLMDDVQFADGGRELQMRKKKA